MSLKKVLYLAGVNFLFRGNTGYDLNTYRKNKFFVRDQDLRLNYIKNKQTFNLSKSE